MKNLIFILSLLFMFANNSSAQQVTKSIYFKNDSYQLSSESKLVLKNCIQKFDDALFEIYGYSDSNGATKYNLELSKKRAQSVKQFFIDNGIDSTKIPIVIGKGENSKFNNFSKNRRVDIVINKVNVSRNKQLIDTNTTDTVLVTKSLHKHKTNNNLDKILNLRVGETLVLRNIQFYPGSDKPLPKAIPDLKKIVQIMKDNPNLKIELQGHICCTNCDRTVEHTLKIDESNELSIRRARYVYLFLVNSGIKKDRLSYKGFGACKPRVKEINENAMQMNRRVEVMIVEK